METCFSYFTENTENTDIFKDFIWRLESDITVFVFLIVDNLRVHQPEETP